MIFTKHATLFLVSTFGIISVAADGGGIRALDKGGKKGKKSKGDRRGPNLVDRKAGKFVSQTINICEGEDPDADDIPCFENGVIDAVAGPQAGINVTEGYDSGEITVIDGGLVVEPITSTFLEAGLCPVNVHWHTGAEHTSAGEYDCTTRECGPTGKGTGRRVLSKYGLLDKKADGTHRGLSDDDGPDRQGFRCNHYDKNDPKFTKPYHFKFCSKEMTVGETYEVHWPHGSFGACNTPSQYQTPFYKGLFCKLGRAGLSFPEDVINGKISSQTVASNFAVQGQVYTIVNDENYYYPDLFRGMITGVKDFGKDIAVYLGSSTGSDRDNTICSKYAPITWQMDRKCHLISASSFDKLCADMLSQTPTDMTADVAPKGARLLVDDSLSDSNVKTLNLN